MSKVLLEAHMPCPFYKHDVPRCTAVEGCLPVRRGDRQRHCVGERYTSCIMYLVREVVPLRVPVDRRLAVALRDKDPARRGARLCEATAAWLRGLDQRLAALAPPEERLPIRALLDQAARAVDDPSSGPSYRFVQDPSLRRVLECLAQTLRVIARRLHVPSLAAAGAVLEVGGSALELGASWYGERVVS